MRNKDFARRRREIQDGPIDVEQDRCAFQVLWNARDAAGYCHDQRVVCSGARKVAQAARKLRNWLGTAKPLGL